MNEDIHFDTKLKLENRLKLISTVYRETEECTIKLLDINFLISKLKESKRMVDLRLSVAQGLTDFIDEEIEEINASYILRLDKKIERFQYKQKMFAMDLDYLGRLREYYEKKQDESNKHLAILRDEASELERQLPGYVEQTKSIECGGDRDPEWACLYWFIGYLIILFLVGVSVLIFSTGNR